MCKTLSKIPRLRSAPALDLSPFENLFPYNVMAFSSLQSRPAPAIGLAAFGAIMGWIEDQKPTLYHGMVYQTTANLAPVMYTYSHPPGDQYFNLDKGHAFLGTAINQAQALFEFCKTAVYPMVPPDWFVLSDAPWYLLTDGGYTPKDVEINGVHITEREILIEVDESAFFYGRRTLDLTGNHNYATMASNLVDVTGMDMSDFDADTLNTPYPRHKFLRRNAVFTQNPFPNGSIGSCAYAMINRLTSEEIKDAYDSMFQSRYTGGTVVDMAFHLSDLFVPIDGICQYYKCAATKYVDTYNTIANAVRYSVLASAGPLPSSMTAIIDGQVRYFRPGFNSPGKRDPPKIRKGVCRPVMSV
jgi:hypothetical protein